MAGTVTVALVATLQGGEPVRGRQDAAQVDHSILRIRTAGGKTPTLTPEAIDEYKRFV